MGEVFLILKEFLGFFWALVSLNTSFVVNI